MRAAGVDDQFILLPRSASTSKAFCKGLSIKQITDKANWSNARTFLTFYRKDIVSVRPDAFQNAVLLQRSA